MLFRLGNVVKGSTLDHINEQNTTLLQPPWPMDCSTPQDLGMALLSNNKQSLGG